jgi:hypothetical protein
MRALPLGVLYENGTKLYFRRILERQDMGPSIDS